MNRRESISESIGPRRPGAYSDTRRSSQPIDLPYLRSEFTPISVQSVSRQNRGSVYRAYSDESERLITVSNPNEITEEPKWHLPAFAMSADITRAVNQLPILSEKAVIGSNITDGGEPEQPVGPERIALQAEQETIELDEIIKQVLLART